MDFLYLSTLFICSIFWGYFDGIQTIVMKLKYIKYNNLKEKIPIEEINQLMIEENIQPYTYGLLIKLLAYVSVIIFIIKLDLFLALCSLLALIIGELFIWKSNFLDNLLLAPDVNKKCDRLILCSNIGLISMILYTITLFISH